MTTKFLQIIQRQRIPMMLVLLLATTNSDAQTKANNATAIQKTFVYKIIGSTRIQADFFPAAGDLELKPVIIWIHGGGLLFGSRKDIPEEQLNFYLAAGYSLFTIDYRLAPETKLPDVVADVRDAVRWVYQNGRDSLKIDPSKVFVVGHSAGAYLALVSGYSKKFRPKAIVSFYGYGDITSKWYNIPDTIHFSNTIISAETARKLIWDSVITSASVEERLPLYFYSRQKGIWPDLVADRSVKTNKEWFSNYCPIRQIDSNYPPVLVIHGENDTDVPFDEAMRLKDKLTSSGIECQLIKIDGYGHLFDIFEGGLSNPKVASVFDDVLVFLKQHKK